MTIYERLDKILPKLLDKSFRQSKGLGNEIGYYIFDYDPKYELVIRQHIKYLKEKINNEALDMEIIEFDLYEIMLEILNGKNYLKKTLDMEKKKSTEKIIMPVKRTLRLTQKNDLLINYIKERVKKNHIVFITGVGKAWPIIRSHTVLNTLHAVIDEVPLVMFFPGTYDGQELQLFNEIKDDNYYRAFKLVDN